MEQAPIFVTDSNLVFQLMKSRKVLKQSPRAWLYANIDNLFLRLFLKLCEFDHKLHVLHTNLYVYDLLITDNNNDLILTLKKKLVDSFNMTNLETMH
jgi:hypothetical protein